MTQVSQTAFKFDSFPGIERFLKQSKVSEVQMGKSPMPCMEGFRADAGVAGIADIAEVTGFAEVADRAWVRG